MTQPVNLDNVKGFSLASAKGHAKYRLVRKGLLKPDERYSIEEAVLKAGL